MVDDANSIDDTFVDAEDGDELPFDVGDAVIYDRNCLEPDDQAADRHGEVQGLEWSDGRWLVLVAWNGGGVQWEEAGELEPY